MAQYRINADTCIHCAACVDTCPVSAIILRSDYLHGWIFYINEDCTGCGACVDSCPVNAIGPS